MSNRLIYIFGRPYDCDSCGLTGIDSADMPPHSAICRSKVALLVVVPKKYVLTGEGKEWIQFQLEFVLFSYKYSLLK